jgi:hypothetical protein
MATQRMNPVAAWRTILDDDPMFPADAILSVCGQCIGAARSYIAAAEEEDAKAPIKETGSRRPRASGHVKQSIVSAAVGVPATLITAYLVYRFGW